MRWYGWSCVAVLFAAAPLGAVERSDGFAHHVAAVQLAPKDEQAQDADLTDFYLDMGREDGALPGMEFWVYRVEWLGPGRRVAIPVGRLRAHHIEDRVCVARLTALTLPAEHALVEYRTILVGDAVEPILGTGLPPLGERDLPAEVLTVDPRLLPAVNAADRAVRTFSIPNIVLFDFDKSTLRPEGKAILDQVAAFVRETHAKSVRIGGHTDAIGTRPYNRGLSKRRADAVRRYFTRTKNIPEKSVTAVGYGETQPVASNATIAGRQRNRRCEIAVDGRAPVRMELDGLAIAPDAIVPETTPSPDAAPAPDPDSTATPPATSGADEAPFPELARPPRS